MKLLVQNIKCNTCGHISIHEPSLIQSEVKKLCTVCYMGDGTFRKFRPTWSCAKCKAVELMTNQGLCFCPAKKYTIETGAAFKTKITPGISASQETEIRNANLTHKLRNEKAILTKELRDETLANNIQSIADHFTKEDSKPIPIPKKIHNEGIQ